MFGCNMPSLHLVSLGCNKNLIDSEIMLGRLQEYNLTDNPASADVIIVNTCGFINSAKEESISTILELAQTRKKGSLLVVAGCLSARYREELAKELPEVDIFTGVGDYAHIDELIKARESRWTAQTYLQGDAGRVVTGSNYHAYVKIAEGCNQKCSFCAIPTFKGKLRSRPANEVAAEVASLVEKGYRDFSFIAQDTSSYLREQGDKHGLVALIDAIERIKGVRAARILYLYPTSADEELIERIIVSPVFVNYFDMPIQHINDEMLSIMRRGTTRAKMTALLTKMRAAPDSFLRTGVIVGHPGETDERFEELCEFLKEFKFDRVSAFAFSREEDTLAYEMEQIPSRTIASRLKKIEKIIASAHEESFAKMVGKRVKVEIEGESSEGEMFYGAKPLVWDRDIDGEVLINDSDVENLEVGGLYECEITEHSGDKLLGRVIRKCEE